MMHDQGVEVKRVEFVVVSSKLHVSERSTPPYIVSTSQPPADRTTFAALSQQGKMRGENNVTRYNVVGHMRRILLGGINSFIH